MKPVTHFVGNSVVVVFPRKYGRPENVAYLKWSEGSLGKRTEYRAKREMKFTKFDRNHW